MHVDRTDWLEWHGSYGNPESPLSERLDAVKALIRVFLDGHRGPEEVRVTSVCAGDGRDLFETLSAYPREVQVRARLVELDPTLAARARASASACADGSDVEVVCADAALTDAYVGISPASLVLLCGVFGNICDRDVERAIGALPELCSPDGVVIWTRHRREPDLTPQIRRWFGEAAFVEEAFVSPGPNAWSVGLHRFAGRTRPLRRGRRLFTFIR